MSLTLQTKIFLIIFVLVCLHAVYLENSPDAKKNEVRIMEIYKEMEYPPGTQVEKHKLEKREERRWIVVNCRSSLPPQDVIAFYDRLFLYRGGEKHLSETHRKIEYDYYIEDYIVVISSLEKGTFRISIHLKRF